MTEIPVEEIAFNPSSYVDTNGRVFEWRGEIFRAIYPGKTPFYLDLMQNGLIQELQEKYSLVNTEITPFKLEGYDLILNHKKIPFLTYCTEWPAPMLKRAALLTLDINIRLAQNGLTLQDAYPWNVYFDGVKPVFIDVGSIIPAASDLMWVAYHQFCCFFLYPLYLYSAGKGKLARLLLGDYLNGVSDTDFAGNLPFLSKLKNSRLLFKVILPSKIEGFISKFAPKLKQKIVSNSERFHDKYTTPDMRVKFFKSLRKMIQSINIDPPRTNWSDYYEEKFPDFDHSVNWSTKQKAIAQILDRIRPETVMDIGCNLGWYSMLAARKGAEVISFDKDENTVSRLYDDAEKEGLYIIPLVMDSLNPSPAFGWCSKQFPSAINRLKTDMVFALALIHHFVFSQRQNFDRVTEVLSAFSKRWLLIEYIPPEDEYIQSLWQDRFEWYTYDNFRITIERKFRNVEIYDSYPEGRKLFLCEK